MKKKILFVVTSHNKKGITGEKTGFYLSEAAHPWEVLTNAGYEIDFVSPKGGKAPVDGLNLGDAVNKSFWNDAVYRQKIEHTLQPSEINPGQYVAIHYVGGHGAMWDFEGNRELSAIAATIYENGGIVSALCHGPAGLVNIKLSNGKYLVDGKKINAFTNEEEVAVKLDKVVPFLLESKLIERGAIFEKSGLWQPHVVTDQRVVTGQNPQSAKAVGEAVLSVLKQQQAVAWHTRYNQIAGGIIIMLAMNNAEAQTNANELAVINQLSTQSAVVNIPVSKLLNAPGNEALKAFFFTPVKNKTALKGKKIAVLVADGFEEIELTGPVWYFRELGAEVDIVAPKYNPAPERYGLAYPEMSKTYVMAIQYLQPVGWIKFDRTADQIKAGDYDAVFIPGGAWNPDNLRADKDVIKFVQDFNKSGKLIAAICHAPVVLASADIIKGKKLTGYWNIQSDLKNAGATVLEQSVVTDGNLVTSRHPIDVADFSRAVENWLLKK